jgi:hypothetical protein
VLEIDASSVHAAALPLAAVFSFALRPFATWLARFFGSWLLMGIFGFVAEIIPRLLGLGQGLVSWFFGVAASASFGAFQMAMNAAGAEVPSFNELLSGLPPGVVWVCSALRLHKVVFVAASILIVRLMRKVLERAASAAANTSAGALMSGGRR